MTRHSCPNGSYSCVVCGYDKKDIRPCPGIEGRLQARLLDGSRVLGGLKKVPGDPVQIDVLVGEYGLPSAFELHGIVRDLVTSGTRPSVGPREHVELLRCGDGWAIETIFRADGFARYRRPEVRSLPKKPPPPLATPASAPWGAQVAASAAASPALAALAERAGVPVEALGHSAPPKPSAPPPPRTVDEILRDPPRLVLDGFAQKRGLAWDHFCRSLAACVESSPRRPDYSKKFTSGEVNLLARQAREEAP